MSTAALLTELQARGVRLSVVEGRLRVEAPKGILTPQDRQTLAERKSELVAALQGRHAQERLDEALPAHLSADLLTWPAERQALWRSRVARIAEETRWPLSKAELAGYWDVQRWWMFLDPQQQPRTLH